MLVKSPPTSPLANTGQNNQQNTQQTDSDAIEKQLNTFLNLLTAQIRNQDPLSPLDSTQFVDQLATFTGLEQQVKANTRLDAISNQMGGLLNLMSNQFVGKTVEVESTHIPFEGKPVKYTAEIPEGIDRAVFTVKDSEGTIIHSEKIDKSDENWTWDGKFANGTLVPNGLYKVSVDLFKDNKFAGSLAPRFQAEVTQASLEDDKIRLGLSNKLSAFADKVKVLD